MTKQELANLVRCFRGAKAKGSRCKGCKNKKTCDVLREALEYEIPEGMKKLVNFACLERTIIEKRSSIGCLVCNHVKFCSESLQTILEQTDGLEPEAKLDLYPEPNPLADLEAQEIELGMEQQTMSEVEEIMNRNNLSVRVPEQMFPTNEAGIDISYNEPPMTEYTYTTGRIPARIRTTIRHGETETPSDIDEIIRHSLEGENNG